MDQGSRGWSHGQVQSAWLADTLRGITTALSSPEPQTCAAPSRKQARAHHFLPSAGAVGVTLALLSLLTLAVVVANTWLLGVDLPLSELARNGAVEGVARLTSNIGGTEVALAVGAVLVAVLWRRCRTAALAVPATLIAGALLNVAFKEIVGRARPADPSTSVSLASFPSGHSFQATLLLGLVPLAVLVITRREAWARWSRLPAAIGMIAVAASRVVLGAHWPTDVIAGLLVGLALLGVTHHLLDRWHRGERNCDCALSFAGA